MSLFNATCAICQKNISMSQIALTLADKSVICNDCAKSYNIPLTNSWGWPSKITSRWASEHDLNDFKRLVRNHSDISIDLLNGQLIETQIEMQIASANPDLGKLKFKQYSALADTLDTNNGEYIKYIAQVYLERYNAEEVMSYIVFTNTRMLIVRDNGGMKVIHEAPLNKIKHVKREHHFFKDVLYIRVGNAMSLTSRVYKLAVFDDKASKKITKIIKHHAKQEEGIDYGDSDESDWANQSDDNSSDEVDSGNVTHINHISENNTSENYFNDNIPQKGGSHVTMSRNGMDINNNGTHITMNRGGIHISHNDDTENTDINLPQKGRNSNEHIADISHVNNKQALDPADEIRKFKELEEDGIITKEEFEAKKKQLLGL